MPDDSEDDQPFDDPTPGDTAAVDDALLADLDELATISSVEAFYAAELPALHQLALKVTDHPNDRSGRYAAVRDAITNAIELMEDESFADAAQALLGYADRWRSVRDRSTDAGRAFTPSVSYDSFRRRSGRNYRGNTLRLLADALKQLDGPAVAAPLDAEPADPVPARPTSSPPTVDAAAPSAGARRPLVLAAALAVIGLGTFAVMQLGGNGSTTNEVAGTTTTPTITATLVPATTAPATIPTEAAEPPPAFVTGELDVTRHCRLQSPEGARFYGEQRTAGWTCRTASGETMEPDLQLACEEQFGPNASAVALEGSTVDWECELPVARLNNNSSASCAIAPGAHDQGAVTEFGRNPDRFKDEWEQNVPDDVCPIEPLHFYGDNGVTQRLARDGKVHGAILAGDPQNVFAIMGSAWLELTSVRGLAFDSVTPPIISGRVGYPAGGLREVDGVWRWDLDDDSALISATQDGRYVWMPQISLQEWTDLGGRDGCLGLPIGTPQIDPPSQEFENGTMGFDVTQGGLAFEPPELCS